MICNSNKPVFEYSTPYEKGHGRLEHRIYRVFNAELGYLQDEWPFVRKIIEVTRHREIPNRKLTMETKHYYVSNGGIRDDQFPICIRKHWGIENQNHYVRDETLREDFTIKRRNPIIFATCISMALNIMRFNGDKNISETTYVNSLDLQSTLLKYSRLM